MSKSLIASSKSAGAHGEDKWDVVIKPKSSFFSVPFREIWKYRDLLIMFIRRDVVTVYKQTILGPLWFVIQPIFTSLIYLIVFGQIAKVSTDGVPQILFYLAGVTLWTYFADSFNNTSKTFKDNEQIFGKVYFPRLIMPLSKVLGGLIKFFIQFCFFLLVWAYYFWGEGEITPTYYIFLLPVFLLLMAGYGLGFGIIFTSLTTKYRDLTFLIQFGVQLMMYATPVIYPISTVPDKYREIIMANPLTPILEGFKLAFLGAGTVTWGNLIYSFLVMIVVLFMGILIFNKTEKTFMDTV